MKSIKSINKVIKENTILETDYQEVITVQKNVILIIEGQTNRLIDNIGGTIIIKGSASRINCFGGKVIVEEKGYLDSLYGGGKGAEIEIKGSIHEIFIFTGTKLIMKKGSFALSINSEDATTIIEKDVYVKNYGQWGKSAYCLISKNSNVVNCVINNGVIINQNEVKNNE